MGSKLNGIRWIMAVVGLLAVYLQAAHLVRIDRFVLSQFLSFFTIQSNLFAAGVLALVAAGGLGLSREVRDRLRGAMVLYLGITGIVYAVLLARLPEVKAVVHPWADPVLHYVIPLWLLADWLLDPPSPELSFRSSLIWLVYPLVYLLIALVRGSLTGWYTYPFLNPNGKGGWAEVVIISTVLILFATATSWLIVVTGRTRRNQIAKKPSSAGLAE